MPISNTIKKRTVKDYFRIAELANTMKADKTYDFEFMLTTIKADSISEYFATKDTKETKIFWDNIELQIGFALDESKDMYEIIIKYSEYFMALRKWMHKLEKMTDDDIDLISHEMVRQIFTDIVKTEIMMDIMKVASAHAMKSSAALLSEPVATMPEAEQSYAPSIETQETTDMYR